MSPQKVIIFDSGVGGLSIWQEVQRRLAEVECHYLFDNAYFPYGELDEETLIDRVCTLVPALVEHCQADAVVIACNTASTAVLVKLRELLGVPVVGVVPAIKPAAEKSVSRHIALLATPATVRRAYTQKLIEDFASDCQISLFGSSNLVYLAEEYLLTGKIDDLQLAKELADLIAMTEVDTVVLGCTHFPLIRDAVANILNSKVSLIDSGEAIARQLERILPDGSIKATKKHQYYFTKTCERVGTLSEGFKKFGFKKGQMFQSAP